MDFPTIQQAIDDATDGDEIIVQPGTYVENIHFDGKNIILRSTDPMSFPVMSTTIIDGNAAGSVVTFAGTELATCTLTGFTITNGYALKGGGIHGNPDDLTTGTLATIKYNKITANTAHGSPYYQINGAGIFDCDGLIEYNLIADNTSSYGGGLGRCDGTIRYNEITRNTAAHPDGWAGQGGGLYYCAAAIHDNVITSNTASATSSARGGGIENCFGPIHNNLIAYNKCEGTGSSGGGIISSHYISDNIIIYNEGGSGGGVSRGFKDFFNNIVAFNKATLTNGGGLVDVAMDHRIAHNTIVMNSAAGYGGGISSSSTATISNCIIWGNSCPDSHLAQVAASSTPTYSCIEGWTSQDTNIAANPMLINPESLNFSLDPDSPCVDAGQLIEDMTIDRASNIRGFNGTDDPRGDGSDFDIGALESILKQNAVGLPWWRLQ